MTPRISIIIPTFNRAHLIAETLDSIIAQTYENWECIVVDDGSTDNTAAILKGYCTQDKRISYHLRPKDRPKGGNAARNYGFEQSKGTLIQWFDSDDLMHPNHLEKKERAFKKENDAIDYVYCGFKTFSETNKDIKTYNLSTETDLINGFLYKKVVLNLQSFLFHRNAIGDLRLDESLFRAQDLDYAFRFLSEKKRKGFHSNEVLLAIRIHEQRITTAYTEKKHHLLQSELRVRYEMLVYVINNKTISEIKLAGSYYLTALIYLLEAGYLLDFIRGVIRFKSINLPLKAKLIFLALTHRCFRKGLYSIKTIKTENFK
ncbi:glycosyltransferase [unidentified eubacterium SCB49]|nr:glycosyltransferase [unidentified eubacterium SCB49]